jgi:hypothetical protein
MGTGIRMVWIAIGAIVALAATARGVDFDTIGVIIMLAGLVGMLVALVCCDSWQSNSRPAVDGRDGTDAVLPNSAVASRSVDR